MMDITTDVVNPDQPPGPNDSTQKDDPKTNDVTMDEVPTAAEGVDQVNRLEQPLAATKLWKDLVTSKQVTIEAVEKKEEECVETEEEVRASLPDGFLDGKIKVTFPEGADGDPRVTIETEVLETLASVWTSTMVVKTLGTLIPFNVMARKVKELWKPKGHFRLIDFPNAYYMVKFASADDYMRVLTGGPWSMFGHYLILKPWTPTFDPLTDVVATTPAWVRISNLPVFLYEEGVLLQVAAGMGRPIKVDKKTLHANRGRYARVCVEMDLTKPLKGSVFINGNRYLVEDENLHSICFHCGRYGHFQPNCPTLPSNIEKKQKEAEACKDQRIDPNRRTPAGEEKFGG
ncbi:uncharacterized protein A4U43_C05F7290 [Asparagus officinalis]|uniref:CCHC-type domain-containing protein n=1 Tax=Asparagus officinalis TaxID=4686 RepID=A0A5P1ESK0_ASPOF|nr:uncharacterized protein A4U43_C05F7290 [Asparagus officinalis]